MWERAGREQPSGTGTHPGPTKSSTRCHRRLTRVAQHPTAAAGAVWFPESLLREGHHRHRCGVKDRALLQRAAASELPQRARGGCKGFGESLTEPEDACRQAHVRVCACTPPVFFHPSHVHRGPASTPAAGQSSVHHRRQPGVAATFRDAGLRWLRRGSECILTVIISAPLRGLRNQSGAAISRTFGICTTSSATGTEPPTFLPPRGIRFPGKAPAAVSPTKLSERSHAPHHRREEPVRSPRSHRRLPSPLPASPPRAAGLPAGRAGALRGGHAPGDGGVRDAADPGRGNAGPVGGGGVSAGQAGSGEMLNAEC